LKVVGLKSLPRQRVLIVGVDWVHVVAKKVALLCKQQEYLPCQKVILR